jgi:hypothetical protein
MPAPNKGMTKIPTAHKSVANPKTAAPNKLSQEPSSTSTNQLTASNIATQAKTMDNETQVSLSSWVEEVSETGTIPVLYHAPHIPAGMEPFHQNPPESTGMDRNLQEWHWNLQEWHWNGLK